MSVIRCSRTAAAVGRLHDQDRKAMERLWLREYESAKASGLGLGAAENQASQQVRNAMIGLAAHMRVVAQLQREAMDRIGVDAARFRNRKGQADIGEYAQQLINSVHFDAQAGFQLDLTELGAVLHEFRKTTLSGTRANRARMDLVVREIFGENTGDPTAKAFADSWNQIARRKIEQFNAAGGNVALRDDWHMPQTHNGVAVVTAGLQEWKNYIRGRLDMSAMTNPHTGKAFTASEFEDFLDEAFQSITWGTSEREASMQGQYGTSAWRRHADPRFFVFKDAASWMEYSSRFGAGTNPFETMMGYLRNINHELAAMRRLGPHANGTVRWLAGSENNKAGGRILAEAIKADQGRPALFPRDGNMGLRMDGKGRRQYAKDKSHAVQGMWDYFTGEMRRPQNDLGAEIEASINNLLYANMLAFTPFLVGSDVVNQAASRAFRGVSMSGMMRDFVEAVRLSRNPKELAELAIELDVGLSVLNSEARDQALLMGSPVTQWVADRALTYTGLKPMTMGLRAMWSLGVWHEITRHAQTAFDKLPADFRAMLERYDIDRHAWEFVAATPRTNRAGVDVIRPADLMNMNIFSLGVQARPGLTQAQEVAARIAAMIKEEGEAATISGTPRSARMMPFKPGTTSGFFLGSLAKLKTYSISHVQHHGYRAAEIFWRHGGGIRGMGQASMYYMAGLMLPSMTLVAMGTVLSEVLKGRDPPDVTDPKFVESVIWKTVSLGFYQDFVRGMTTTDTPMQYGAQIGGPLVSLGVSGAALIGDFATEADTAMRGAEDETQTGRQAIRFARKIVPRHWALDTAVERLIWDNMQRAVDPAADEDFRRRASRVEQGMWWEPGQNEPSRAPDWSTLDLQDQNGDYVQ